MLQFKVTGLMVALYCCVGSMALAAEQRVITGGDVGGYLGIQLGSMKFNNNPQYAPENISMAPNINIAGADSSVVGRILFGYQSHANFAMEVGYSLPTVNTYTAIANNKVRVRLLQNIDVLGKVIMPLQYGFKLNLLAGMTYLKYFEQYYSASASLVTNNQKAMRPDLGVAISYNITPNWQASINLQRIQGKVGLPNMNRYTVGLNYNMVELYCGQFLC